MTTTAAAPLGWRCGGFFTVFWALHGDAMLAKNTSLVGRARTAVTTTALEVA